MDLTARNLVLGAALTLLILTGCGKASVELVTAVPTAITQGEGQGNESLPVPTDTADDNGVTVETIQPEEEIRDGEPDGNSTPNPVTVGDEAQADDVSSCSASAGTPEAVMCAVESALLARDMVALQRLMADPFVIGYWASEGRTASPAEISEELDQACLPEDTSVLTFSTGREQFPPLAGMPPERMFGPEVTVALIGYSEGWGQDGLGAALIYIAQNEVGEFYWHGMVYSGQHFDK